jgi:dUTP pyrophosphatase
MKVLKMCVDPALVEYYTIQANLHNNQKSHPNSGFDLFSPIEYVFPVNNTFKVDFKVRCAMYDIDSSMNPIPMGFYLFPRSSIAKTPFRLSNSVGIIDSGYRGNIGAYFDVIENDANKNGIGTIDSLQRLVQICAPTLEPFTVLIVDGLDETERGEKGFGSSGL